MSVRSNHVIRTGGERAEQSHKRYENEHLTSFKGVMYEPGKNSTPVIRTGASKGESVGVSYFGTDGAKQMGLGPSKDESMCTRATPGDSSVACL